VDVDPGTTEGLHVREEIYTRIRQCQPAALPFVPSVPTPARAFIQGLLQTNAKLRTGICEVLEHEWLAETLEQ
jgi:hypothetical protein